MMNWGYGSGMQGWGGMGTWGLLTWLVVFIDLVLLGLWLWKQLTKK